MISAAPCEVIHLEHNSFGMLVGRVNFGGVHKEVSFAYLPDVKVGDYVVVHVGFALSKVDVREALKPFEDLRGREKILPQVN